MLLKYKIIIFSGYDVYTQTFLNNNKYKLLVTVNVIYNNKKVIYFS